MVDHGRLGRIRRTPPSSFHFFLPPFAFLCSSSWSNTTFEYGRACTAEGSPYSHWMDLWQVRTTAARAISIPGLLSTAAVCPSRYGCALETAVIDRKQSPSGAAPGFPALYDADFFPGPPLSYFLWEVDEG
jgi:hypothetical protein